VIGVILRADEKNVTVGSVFYVWISVLNLMLVSVFWSFLLEMYSSAQTKRLFGVIAAGGTLGALVGPLTTRLAVGALGNSGIMFIGAVGFVAAIVCQQILLRIWRKRPNHGADETAQAAERGIGGNPFAGISIVFKSPYLLGIALFVVLLSAANTFLYFEQLRIVKATFTDTTRRTEVFANLDVIVQSLTIFTQFFLTGKIASRLGVRALLTLLPAAMVLSFLGLAAVNVFGILAIVFVMRRWGEYAFIRPGREMLFSTLDTETKYKAKNFIDVPVYRAADYVGAQAKTALDAINASPTASILVASVLAAAWAVNGWLLGRKHDSAASAP
jgi:AAA family ATP:ADP antiporter